MELQQVILGIVGSSLVTSLLTTYLNNKWTDRRLRDQWKREKEERREQWRREQEARRREWKRQYREELLRPFLEKVNRIVAMTGFIASQGLPGDSLEELAKGIFSARALGIGDRAFLEFVEEFFQAVYSYLQLSLEVSRDDTLREQYVQVQAIAHKLHGRAQVLLEETFD